MISLAPPAPEATAGGDGPRAVLLPTVGGVVELVLLLSDGAVRVAESVALDAWFQCKQRFRKINPILSAFQEPGIFF